MPSKTTPYKRCKQCPRIFFKPQNESKKNWETRHKFCSLTCNGKFHYSKSKDKFDRTNKSSWNKGKPCSEGTKLKLSNKLKGKPLNESTKQKMLGRIPWNKGRKWKKKTLKDIRAFGVNKAIRTCDKYKAWRRRVRRRDNWTCQLCGISRVMIHVDHIIPLAYIIKSNKISKLSQALKCKELWKSANGRTLCVPCHRATSTYGRSAANFKK